MTKSKNIIDKSPWEWTEEEIHELVMREVGEDVIHPRGFYVLVKIWTPPEEYESGLIRTDNEQRSKTLESNHGMILRCGGEVFVDKERFPFGARFTYGEWATFRGSERIPIEVNGHRLAQIHDDRFISMIDDPSRIKTTFDLEYEHTGG